MYTKSLSYYLKATPDKKAILEMFFKDWTDRICNNEVRYSSVTGAPEDIVCNEIIRVEFAHDEDAVAMKLKGIPPEFQQYLSLI